MNLHRLFLFSACTLALLTMSACRGKSSPDTAIAEASTLHRGISGEPASLDPAFCGDNYSIQVLEDLYEGLTVESPSGAALPGVAESWTVSASGLQYVFHLRSDARWSNGVRVRAQDFVTAWRRVVDPRQGSPVADNLRLIAGASAILSGHAAPASLGVQAQSDDVLVVNLERPAAFLPEVMAHSAAFPIYSDAAARAHQASAWVSNGAYVLSRWLPGAQLSLVRNDAYWDKAHVHIAAVDYLFASDETSQYARYRAGQLDLTDSVPAGDIRSLRAERSKELLIAPFIATAYYGLNLSEKTLGGSAALRQALAMAIDRPKLVDMLGFGQPAAYGFVPPGTWNYTPQSWHWKSSGDAERIAEARRLYATAGFSRAAPMHLRVLFNANPVIKRTAILIAAMWRETLGIDTTLSDEEYRVFLESRHDKSRWDAVRLGWNADFNDAGNFLDTLRTGSVNNDPGYSNPAFDTLIDQAEAATDVARRRALLEQAERVMLEDYPIVPLYFLVSKQLVKPYVTGINPTPLNQVASKTLTLLPH